MSKSLFIAAGHDGLRIYSADGRTWQGEQLGKEGETYRCVAFGGGRCVAAGIFGGKNIFAATSDGQTWQPSSSDAGYIRYVQGLAYGNGRFLVPTGEAVTVGAARFAVLSSENGVDWTRSAEEPRSRSVLRRIVQGRVGQSDIFVGVGDRGRRASSADGITWVNDETAKPPDTLIDVAFGAGLFVGVGMHGLRMTSADGKTWGERQVGEEGEHLNSVLWTGERFVAIGLGATYFSDDGRKWERRSNEFPPLAAAFGDGLFVGVRWKGLLLHSSDALVWREAHRASRHVEAVAFGPLSGT